MSGESSNSDRKGCSFWTRHERAVASAGVDLSVHLRDILRRPPGFDIDGFGPFERVEALLKCGDAIQLAVAETLEANDSLPETTESNVVFQVSLRALHGAILPAIEFFEAPDLWDASADAEFVDSAVLVACTVLSAFASLQIEAESERLAKALATSISYMERENVAESDLESSSQKVLVTVDEVLEFAVPGIAAIIESDESLILLFTDVAEVLAGYAASKIVALVDDSLSDEARAVSETHAQVAVHVLCCLVKAAPALSSDPQISTHVTFALSAVQDCDQTDALNCLEEELLCLREVCRIKAV